ncbi:MAG: hypothetical protein ACLUHC_04845 [Clostridia bacterium]
MKNILKTVCVIIGTIIGAGFASGQEVYIFFFSHGIKGLIGIIISSVIIGLIIYKSLKIIKYENIQNYDEFLKNLIRNKKIKDFADILINIFILISFYIMIAGFGAYLEQELHINSILGSGILSIICYFIFQSNLKGVVKVNQFLIPILIVVIVFVRIFEYKRSWFKKYK